MSLKRAVADLWTKHRWTVLVLVFLYFVILLVITILASGPQSEPFLYQGR